MNKPIQKQKGFTLSEMMIVITIIAIVTVISVRIQKSRTNYETKFMTYSALMNLKQATGEVVADGWKDAGGTSKTGVPDIWDSTTSPHFGFCQRLANPDVTGCPNCGAFNTIGTVNCNNSANDLSDFSSVSPIFTLTNGQRFFHDNTNTTPPYTIYIDINGSKSPQKLYKDVIKFTIDANGLVSPEHTAVVANQNAADKTDYLTANVRYRDASGNMIIVDQGIDFYTANCDAYGNYYGAGCITSKYTTTCQPNNCEVTINRPGF